MKKLLNLATFGALFGAATAHAQLDFYVTGSTAFRANAYRSIRAMYGANLTSQNPADTSNTSGSNVVTWAGTLPGLFGAQVITVHASYTGSAAGVQSLVQNTTPTFYTSATPGSGATVAHTADLAFSDAFQATTAFPSSPPLSDSQVGVLAFAYVKSVTAPSTFTNITIQQLASLLPNGVIPLSYFTGNASDDAASLYLVGRDTGSGTRITAETDALFIGTSLLWAPDVSCNWNVSVGFSSGSGVSSVLNGTCGPAVGYLSLSDANNVNSGLNIIRYDGYLPYSGTAAAPNFAPIRKGLYSFWGYEHLYKRAVSSANVTSFRSGLATEINNDLATSTTAIQIGSMAVSRNADGGPISP